MVACAFNWGQGEILETDWLASLAKLVSTRFIEKAAEVYLWPSYQHVYITDMHHIIHKRKEKHSREMDPLTVLRV